MVKSVCACVCVMDADAVQDPGMEGAMPINGIRGFVIHWVGRGWVSRTRRENGTSSDAHPLVGIPMMLDIRIRVQSHESTAEKRRRGQVT